MNVAIFIFYSVCIRRLRAFAVFNFFLCIFLDVCVHERHQIFIIIFFKVTKPERLRIIL